MRAGAVIAATGVPGGFHAYDDLKNTDRNVMLRRMIRTFQRAGAEDIVILTGERAEETEKSLSRLGVAFLRCEDFESGQMMDFAVRGFRYLKKCDRIFFCPADVPLFSDDTIRKMLSVKEQIVIPVCGGRKGHPVLINAELTERIAQYKGECGLKGALDATGVPVGHLDVDDDGVLVRARKEDHFEELTQKGKRAVVYPRVKIQLTRNVPFFGPGMMILLKQIDLLGNVREACEKAGMSYSKGWSLIRTAEKELGALIVDRSPGGKNGGIARVSPVGYELMKKYEQLEREIAEYAEKRYRYIFGNLG